MKLRKGPSCITDGEIWFQSTTASREDTAPWGQFERIQRAKEDYERRSHWQYIIDHVLIEWGQHPERLEDDGLRPPTRRSISTACEVACRLRDEGAPLPANVAPTGDGGVAIHFEEGNLFQTIEIDDAGYCESRVLRNGKLIRRSSVSSL